MCIRDRQYIELQKQFRETEGNPDSVRALYAFKDVYKRQVEQAAYHPHKPLNQAIAQHLMQGDLQENLDRL